MVGECFWKVTTDINSPSSTSFVCDSIRYKEGKFIEAPFNSLIFIFDTFRNAEKFARPDHKIWKCEAIYPEKVEFVCGGTGTSMDFLAGFNIFWDAREEGRDVFNVKYPAGINIVEAPEGTYGAKMVRLLRLARGAKHRDNLKKIGYNPPPELPIMWEFIVQFGLSS